MQTYQVIITKEARMDGYLVATSPEGPISGEGHIVPFARENLIRLLRESGIPEMEPERVLARLDNRELTFLPGIPSSVAETFHRRPIH